MKKTDEIFSFKMHKNHYDMYYPDMCYFTMKSDMSVWEDSGGLAPMNAVGQFVSTRSVMVSAVPTARHGASVPNAHRPCHNITHLLL